MNLEIKRVRNGFCSKWSLKGSVSFLAQRDSQWLDPLILWPNQYHPISSIKAPKKTAKKAKKGLTKPLLAKNEAAKSVALPSNSIPIKIIKGNEGKTGCRMEKKESIIL